MLQRRILKSIWSVSSCRTATSKRSSNRRLKRYLAERTRERRRAGPADSYGTCGNSAITSRSRQSAAAATAWPPGVSMAPPRFSPFARRLQHALALELESKSPARTNDIAMLLEVARDISRLHWQCGGSTVRFHVAALSSESGFHGWYGRRC